MTILLILGGALVILAVVLVSAAAGTTESGHAVSGVDRSVALVQALTNAPTALTREYDESFTDRIMAPFQSKALTLARRLSGKDAAERIRLRLDVAGNPEGWTIERVQAGKVIGAIALFLISLALTAVMGVGFPLHYLLVGGATLVGWFGPNLYLYQRVYERSNLIQRSLPDAIDLLTISVESGLAFDAAIQQVARNTQGPLAEEFSRVLREMQIGQGRGAGAPQPRRPVQRRRPAQLRDRDGAGRQLRHPDRQRAAHPVVRDAHQAAPASRGEGPEGPRQDHDPADLLHPAVPVHRGDGTCRHPHHGFLRQVTGTDDLG